jgi:hypothetical protein
MTRNRTLGAPYEQLVVTQSFTTVPDIDRYLVETPLGGLQVVVTLDPDAFNGDQVVIIDAGQTAGTQPIQINPSDGQEIFGASTIATNGDSVLLTFSSELGGWTTQWSSSVETAPTFSSKLQAAGTVVTAGDDITGLAIVNAFGSEDVPTVNLLVTAWASYTYTPGVVTPVIKVSQNGGPSETLVAFAQESSGQSDISMTQVFNVAVAPGLNTFTLALQTSGGDATITLGHGVTGFSAGLTAAVLPAATA